MQNNKHENTKGEKTETENIRSTSLVDQNRNQRTHSTIKPMEKIIMQLDLERILRTLKSKQTRQQDALAETNNHIQLIEQEIVEQQKQKMLELEKANPDKQEKKK